MRKIGLGVLLLLGGLGVVSSRADSFPDCADKLYRYLPGSDLATRRKAEQVCSYGQSADKLISCADAVARLLPGSGGDVKRQALDLCVDMTAQAVTPDALARCSDRVYRYLPRVGGAARLRAIRACRHGVGSEALIACVEKASGSVAGGDSKERALSACVEELRPSDPRVSRRLPSDWPALTAL